LINLYFFLAGPRRRTNSFSLEFRERASSLNSQRSKSSDGYFFFSFRSFSKKKLQ